MSSAPKYFCVIAALAFVSVLTAAQSSNAKGEDAFQIAPVSSQSLGVWEGDKPVLVYNHGHITNSSAPKAQPHSAYVHPIYGLDGEVLTGDFPADHVYHRGLFWAWSHIKIGESEYDLWSLRGIHSTFERWIDRTVGKDVAALMVENAWVVSGKKVMREQVGIRVNRADKVSRSIDFELSWSPIEEPITLWGAPGKSYGGFTLRFGKRSRTIVTVPEGRTTEDLLMTKLPWADFTGDFGSNGLSGAAIFIHPDHPAYPPEWMTREYGVLAVGYPGVTRMTVSAGETLTLRYRLWVHRGNPTAPEIEKTYHRYLKEVREK